MENKKKKLTNRERKRGNHSSLFSVELREFSLQLLKESFFIMTMRFVAEIFENSFTDSIFRNPKEKKEIKKNKIKEKGN